MSTYTYISLFALVVESRTERERETWRNYIERLERIDISRERDFISLARQRLFRTRAVIEMSTRYGSADEVVEAHCEIVDSRGHDLGVCVRVYNARLIDFQESFHGV